MSVDKEEKLDPNRVSRFMWEGDDDLEVVEAGDGESVDLDELLATKPK